MNPQEALNRRAQVEDFQRRHRTKLVTMLFSDIVGSTKLKQILGDRGAIDAIQAHHALFREVLGSFDDGEEISTTGDGFFLVFAKPSDAVKFSLLAQAGLRRMAEETGHPVLDRIGIHVGEVWVDEKAAPGKSKDLYGIQVDTCARVSSLGEADQVLLTRFAFDSARQVLKGDELENLAPLSWLNHGPYAMKGVEETVEVCEVGETGKAALTRPDDTEKARRFPSPESEPVLGWRPAVDQPVPGTSWVLEKKLGEGGFGEVWLGRDKILKTRHVFKFCFRADRVRSLKREVTLFRLLKERVGVHPNIVGVEATYFDEPPFYIVVEHVDGSDLRQWCEAGGGIENVPLSTRLEIAAQVADALKAAHESGVIHRDVKPSNILVGGEGGGGVRVHLTDFGIGHVISEEALAGITRGGFTVTMMDSGSRGGTRLYMAPELIAGSPASPQSDLYSLGVVLYQLIVGDLSRPLATDWSDDVADVSLREDLRRCFARDPAKRFATTGELAESLRSLENRRALLAEKEAAAGAQKRIALKRRRMLIATAAVAIVTLLAGLIFYGWQQRHRADGQGREIQRLVALLESANELAREGEHKLDELAQLTAQADPTPEQQAKKQQLAEDAHKLAAAAEEKRREVSNSPLASSVNGRGGSFTYSSSEDFDRFARKLREASLASLEPRVLTPTTSGSRGVAGRYPWKTNIVTIVFSVGQKLPGKNGITRRASAWNRDWLKDFGGYDNPDPGARKDFMPINFIPKENPFYAALPYNDVSGGHHKPEARTVIPWFAQAFERDGESVCHNRWIAIRKGNRVCYAQWSDCGPFRTDHWEYVFGNETPKPNLSRGAGLDVSPAVRDYLGLGAMDVTDWKFVEVRDVPNGPWAHTGTNNTVAQLRGRNTSAVVSGAPLPNTPKPKSSIASDGPTVITRDSADATPVPVSDKERLRLQMEKLENFQTPKIR